MRIFIAEKDQDIRVGLLLLFDQQPGFQVVGIAVRSKGLVRQAAAATPDVILLDWELVTTDPDYYIRNLQAIPPLPKIIVTHVQPETRDAAIAAGADGFSSKDQSPNQLWMILRDLI
jgi:DNA-binding NarL/FixJ family response regulator